MQRYYINKKEVDKVIQRISQQQSKSGVFANIAVKPYNGKKYDPQNTAVVIVG